MSEKFPVPILLVIFNRPSTTQKVFDQIKILKPAKLYISADGPRNNIDSDKKLCEEARRIIEQIDWDCELHTRFLDVRAPAPNQELDNSIMSGVSEKTPQYLCALKLGRIGRMLHIFPLFQRFHPLRVGFFVKQTIKDLRVRGV